MKGLAPENRLTENRNKSRLTLEEVSKITGFDVTTISSHENRRRSMSEDAILAYAKLYKVNTHELFVLDGE